MTDLQALTVQTLTGLAHLLDSEPPEAWDAPSLCHGWRVRHVVAHVTMPARLTPDAFRAALAAAGGDFTALSDSVADRDSTLPLADHLAQLRSPALHSWQPPGGGAGGALSHAVIHSLDVTVPLDRPSVAPVEARVAVLDQLTAANGAIFGLDVSGVRLAADDVSWQWGDGTTITADSGRLIALLSGRSLPDGRTLRSR